MLSSSHDAVCAELHRREAIREKFDNPEETDKSKAKDAKETSKWKQLHMDMAEKRPGLRNFKL